jgi:hypothetical protein
MKRFLGIFLIIGFLASDDAFADFWGYWTPCDGCPVYGPQCWDTGTPPVCDDNHHPAGGLLVDIREGQIFNEELTGEELKSANEFYPDDFDLSDFEIIDDQYYLVEHIDGKVIVREALPQENIRRVSHVTRPSQGFLTEIVLENLTDNDHVYHITPYDSKGNKLTKVNGLIHAGESLNLTVEDIFFNDEVVAHFTIFTRNNGVQVSTLYKHDTQNTIPAIFRFQQNQSKKWRLIADKWDQIFDGLSIVNYSFEDAEIIIHQKNAEGTLIKSVSIGTLKPNERLLYLLGAPGVINFSLSEGKFFEIEGTDLIGVTALRGTIQEPFILCNNAAIPF